MHRVSVTFFRQRKSWSAESQEESLDTQTFFSEKHRTTVPFNVTASSQKLIKSYFSVEIHGKNENKSVELAKKCLFHQIVNMRNISGS